MKRLLFACLLTTSMEAPAWDPSWVLNNAVRSQVNQRINRGVAEVFRSIENPSIESQPTDSGVTGARADGVVLYGTARCGYCIRARKYMHDHNIPFQDKDVGTDSQAKSEWQSLGGRGVPVILMGNQKLTGFSPATFDNAYQKFQAERANALPSVPGDTSQATAAAGLTAGDVLAARLAKVKVLAAAEPAARSLGLLSKGEEVIYLGESQGRYLKVQGADQEGWVDRALVAKR